MGLVLRRIPNEFLTFEQLGLPAVIEELIQRPRGLILVTGPTGSGKTTSLASMINYINNTMDRHIITIEDPIEYFHKHNKSLINQREIGVDVPDFPEAIRRALRMDPDIILVGEMRDLATISAAITAAETGHIVFGTLHTNSAEGTVNRVIDVFPKDQQDQIRTQLSVAIIGILAQALLPRKPKGLVAAYEMLVVTPAIANLIRENKTYRIDSSIQTGRKHGMILLDDSLFNLWKQGLVEESEVMFKSRKPNDLRERIENAKKGIFDETGARRMRRMTWQRTVERRGPCHKRRLLRFRDGVTVIEEPLASGMDVSAVRVRPTRQWQPACVGCTRPYGSPARIDSQSTQLASSRPFRAR